MKKLVISLLVAAPLSTAAVANPVDNYGATAIQSSDFAGAEASLIAHLRKAPADQPALLNLAHIYRQTARAHQANALYQRVLNRSDVLLTTTQGTATSSHAVARAGLTGTASFAMR